MLTLLIVLSVIGFSYATPSCLELHKSQLASLNERMNQMISSLYTSLPLPTTNQKKAIASKTQSNATPPSIPSSSSYSDYTSIPYNAYYPYPPYAIPVPQVVYVPSQFPLAPPPVPVLPPMSVPFMLPSPAEPAFKSIKSSYYSQNEPQPYDFAYPGSMDPISPWLTHNDHYSYTQYPPPQYHPVPYPQPLPYPPPCSYSEHPGYLQNPLYPLVPSHIPPPPVYSPPPTPYPLPPLYHKSSEIPPPAYYI